jgi:hypothetical protein
MKIRIKRMKKAASSAEKTAERALKNAAASMRSGAKALRKAEKAGKLDTWKNRVGMAMQLVQVAMLVTAAAKGLRVGKAAAARRPARAIARRSARKKSKSR